MNPTKKTKIIFSPFNVDEYERQFIIEHQIAMGYMSPIIPRTQNVVELMNQAYPVPSPLDASFRRWIDHQQAARFDCFKPTVMAVYMLQVRDVPIAVRKGH